MHLSNELELNLETHNYEKAEARVDALLELDMTNKEVMFLRSIVGMCQYTFGGTRVKESAAYLKRSDGVTPDPEFYAPHLEHMVKNATSELQGFIEGVSESARKESVGTITDPAWKMVTDTAVINTRVDKQSEEILDVIRFLFAVRKLFPASNLGQLVDEYTQYAARYGTDLGKHVNALRSQQGYTQQSTSSCFVATAVYGSPSAPEVVLLRQFRDDVMLGSFPGRIASDLYYSFGPRLARVVSSNRRLHQISLAVVNCCYALAARILHQSKV